MIPQIVTPNTAAEPPKPFMATETERDEAGRAAKLLSGGFDWTKTVEGSEFWYSVHQRLSQISENGILREY